MSSVPRRWDSDLSMAPEPIPSPPGVLLSVRGLRTGFPLGRGSSGRGVGRLWAVDEVSFDIIRGETLGLVGESGCGKTTLGRSILRLIEPTAGSVHFAGVDLIRASSAELRRLRRDMQVVFQDPFGSLNPRMTVGRIIAEPLVIHRVGSPGERQELVARLLTRVGLGETDADRLPHEFSGGQRQRIGIARALSLGPKFVILDEPVSALDVSIQSQILNLLSELKSERGLTYLFIAHNLAVVRRFSDRVAVMYLGRIVEIAGTDELYTRPGHPYTMALLAAVPHPDPSRRCRMPGPGRTSPSPASEPPDPADPPAGCAFHPRCPLATRECRENRPHLEHTPSLSQGQRVACHHVDTILSAKPPRRP